MIIEQMNSETDIGLRYRINWGNSRTAAPCQMLDDFKSFEKVSAASWQKYQMIGNETFLLENA
jgi:hypothetical protein